MPSIYTLKPAFQNLLRPLVRYLAKAGITPNQITLSAMVLSFVSGGLVFWKNEERWPLLFIPLVLFLRMALNAMDGMLGANTINKAPWERY